jgi:large subunit ribosomal protein L25
VAAEVKLQVEKRDGTGKGVARRARMAGQVPGVIYGRGMDPVAVVVDRREFVTALHTDAGMNVLLSLQLGKESIPALARDLQRDPVRGTLLHADFVKIDLMTEVEVDVPIHVVGDAPGVKEGGVMEHPLFQVRVRCLPTAVPESVDVDVSNLNMGESLRVADLAEGRDFEILNDPDSPVVSIAAPISEAELEAMEAAAQAPVDEEAAAAEAEAAEAGAEEGEAAPDEAAPSETPATEQE